MSNIFNAMIEEEYKKEEAKQRKWLEDLATIIVNTKPDSMEYSNLKFLFDNKDKIIRNRQLIKLLG